MQYDVRNGVFRPAANGGGIFDNSVSGLGSLGQMTPELFDWLIEPEKPPLMQKAGAIGPTPTAVPAMQWGVYSDATKQFQTALNAKLATLGKPPINADGKLGPTTCAAAKYAGMNPGSPPCQKYGAYPPVGGAPGVPAPPTTAAAAAAMYQPSGLSQKTLAVAIGAVAVGAFVYLYVTKRRKKGVAA